MQFSLQQPGDSVEGWIQVLNSAGIPAAPDSTPTAETLLAGAVDLSFTPTVSGTPVETGLYHVTGTIPAGYVTGNAPVWRAIVVFGGVTYRRNFRCFSIVKYGPISSVGSVTNPVTVAGGIAGLVPPNPAAALNAQSITLVNDYPNVQEFLISGVNAANWTEIVVTIKSIQSSPDSAAAIAVKVSNPSSGSDGMITLNGATPASASYGSISVNTASSTMLDITLNLTAPGSAIAADSYFGEVTLYNASGKAPWLGTFNVSVVQTVRANPSPS